MPGVGAGAKGLERSSIGIFSEGSPAEFLPGGVWSTGKSGGWKRADARGAENLGLGLARAPGGSGARSLTLEFLPQSLGLSNSHDRALVKRKVKELAAAAEKDRKAQEKAARQREKLRRREQEAKKS